MIRAARRERGCSLSEESLIREVEEEVRKEQLQRLWDRFGVYILGLCLAVILVVGGTKLWQYYERQKAYAAGEQYVEAMQLADEGKNDEAFAAFTALAQSSSTGARSLAVLQEAAIRIAKGDIPGAIAAYDIVSADASAELPLKDLARIRAGYLLVDTAPLDELQKRVGALNAEGNPWRNSAREILALSAYRNGDMDAANELLSAIVGDPRASMGSRQRAQILLSMVQGNLSAKAGGGASPAASTTAPATAPAVAPADSSAPATTAPSAPAATQDNSNPTSSSSGTQ